MSDIHTKQLENAHAFLKHLNALDWVALEELMSPDFKHQYLPSTIVPPDGKDDRGREEFIGVLKYNLLTVFDGITASPLSRFSLISPLTILFQYLPPFDTIHGSNAVVFHVRAAAAVQ